MPKSIPPHHILLIVKRVLAFFLTACLHATKHLFVSLANVENMDRL